MTPLKQQKSLIPFSIEHWYSPYKRRRFENRSDQTFCILLIKDVLSVRESANLCRRQNLKQNKSDPDSNSDFRINLYPDVRRISVPNRGYIRRRHSFRQVWLKSTVGCMRAEKTEKC